MDVLYGACVAHGGTKYALCIVDQTTRYKSIYPLTNLGHDVLTQLKQYCADMRMVPIKFISDCDKRLFSDNITTWLSKNNSKIFSAPEGKQRQNRLCERSWRSILQMTRGWCDNKYVSENY